MSRSWSRTAPPTTFPPAACTELSKRGFMVLCFNTRFINNEAQVRWEETPLDVKAAGRIRAQAARHHQGGRHRPQRRLASDEPLRSDRENGAAYCQKPERIVKCGNDVGRPDQARRLSCLPMPIPAIPCRRCAISIPSVTMDEAGNFHVDPSLDPFDPKNGFNPNGASHYSKKFLHPLFRGAVQSDERSPAPSAAPRRSA
jgi:hypothetical protein